MVYRDVMKLPSRHIQLPSRRMKFTSQYTIFATRCIELTSQH